MFRSYFSAACGVVLLGSVLGAGALERPRSDQLEKYRKDGTLKAKVERARRFGNHRARPDVVRRLFDRLGVAPADGEGTPRRTAPLPDWQGMPTTGTNKVLIFLIDFPDYPHTKSYALVSNKVFGAGVSSEYPKESLRQFYLRSSYGKLTLEGSVLGWYTMTNNRSWYTNTFGDDNLANAKMIEEVARYYNGSQDYSQYDGNGDGKIDYFAVIWAGPHGDWSTFWWGYYWSLWSTNITLDGVRFYDFSWQWETYLYPDGEFEPSTIIHETGHALGLPDYYDYDGSVGPDGGVGSLDMMDGTWGDHNGFSKFMLDWLTPTVVTGSLSNATLRPSAQYPEAVMVMPGLTGATAYTEYFLVQNRFRINNDTNFPGNGLIIWHVDATPNDSGTNFRYDNSYTSHKLLRLMEADGLEEIERNYSADAGDFYNTGEKFTAWTWPHSAAYSGAETYVAVTNITEAGTTVTVSFTVGQLPPADPDFSLAITNPAADVTLGNAMTGYVVQGVAGLSAAGLMQWSNTLTGATGTFTAQPSWSASSAALAVGTNVITVTATNRPGVVLQVAADSATNAIYGDGWDTGDDGGSGFGGWVLEEGVNSGHFRATAGANTNMDIAAVAWGFWANSDDTASANRFLDAPMVTGGTFELKFENNWIDTGKSAGVAWRNGAGEYLLEFMFIGGGSAYVVNDSTNGRSTGVSWTGSGVTLKLELTATNTYRLTINGTPLSGDLYSRGDMKVRQFRAWNYSAGSGGNYDVFLTDLKVSGAPLPALSTSDTVIITRDPLARYVFQVVSARGSPLPAAGSYTNDTGTVLTNAAGETVTQGGTQYVCIGWSMPGHEPASGGAAVMTMTVTNTATLTWLWATNYYVASSSAAHGQVAPTGGWYRLGSNAEFTASADAYYHFTNWTGDISPGDIYDQPLVVAVDGPKAVAGNFAANLATNATPEWWLAQHGWTDNFDTAAITDHDADGLATWQEWIAYTDPTNAADVFRAEPSVSTNGAGGNVIGWDARPDRSYAIFWRTNLASGELPLAEGLQHPQARYTDTVHGAESLIFYRVRVTEE